MLETLRESPTEVCSSSTNLIENLENVLQHIPSVFIIGAQSAGKTTMLRRLFEHICPNLADAFELTTGNTKATKTVKEFHFSKALDATVMIEKMSSGEKTTLMPKTSDKSKIRDVLQHLDTTAEIEKGVTYTIQVETPNGLLGTDNYPHEFSFWDFPGFSPSLSENEKIISHLTKWLNPHSLVIVVSSVQVDPGLLQGPTFEALDKSIAIARKKKCFFAVIATRIDEARRARNASDRSVAESVLSVFAVSEESELQAMVAASVDDGEMELLNRVVGYLPQLPPPVLGIANTTTSLLDLYNIKIMARIDDVKGLLEGLRDAVETQLDKLKDPKKLFDIINYKAGLFMAEFAGKICRSEVSLDREPCKSWQATIKAAANIAVPALTHAEMKDIMQHAQAKAGVNLMYNAPDVSTPIVKCLVLMIERIEREVDVWLTKFENVVKMYVRDHLRIDLVAALGKDFVADAYSHLIDKYMNTTAKVVENQLKRNRADIFRTLEHLKAVPCFTLPPSVDEDNQKPIGDVILDPQDSNEGVVRVITFSVLKLTVNHMWTNICGPAQIVWSTLMPRAFRALKDIAEDPVWAEKAAHGFTYEKVGDPEGRIASQKRALQQCLDEIDRVTGSPYHS